MRKLFEDHSEETFIDSESIISKFYFGEASVYATGFYLMKLRRYTSTWVLFSVTYML